MLLPGVREFHAETIDWELSECGMQARFRSDLTRSASEALSAEKPAELFQFCLERMPLELKNEPSRNPARPRDGVLRAVGVGLALPLATALNAITVLRLFAVLFLGRRAIHTVPIPDVQPRETLALAVTVVLLVSGGLMPGLLIDLRTPTASALVDFLSRR